MTDLIKSRKRAPGGGRKKGEPTKLVRIPVGVEDAVKGLIHAYKYYGADDFEAAKECLSRGVLLDSGINPDFLLAFQLTNPESFAHGRKAKRELEQALQFAASFEQHLRG